MPNRSSKAKNPRDLNQLAAAIVNAAVDESPPATETPPVDPDPSSPYDERGKLKAAVALGKMGGAKGGQARAKNLSKRRRAEIAKRAALARWGS